MFYGWLERGGGRELVFCRIAGLGRKKNSDNYNFVDLIYTETY